MKKTGWNELKRRMLALGIAAVMIGNTVDLSALPVLAMEQNQEETVETENPEQKQVQVFDTENVEQDQEQVSDEKQTSDEENAEQNQEQASDEENADQNQNETSDAEDADKEQPVDVTEGSEHAEGQDSSEAEDESEDAEEAVDENAEETAAFAAEDETAVQLGNEINIASEDITTDSWGYVVVNKDNIDQWNGKTLTGSSLVEKIEDPGRGLLVRGVELNLTIKDLTIDRRLYSGTVSAIALSDGATLHLTLEGTNTLYGNDTGILVPGETKLTITAESTGILNATGGSRYGGGAGIGAAHSGLNNDYGDKATTRSCGTIRIDGGTVNAQGGTYYWRNEKQTGGAGIGATYGASGGKIEITGGTVNAKGGFLSAGIGGGWCGSVESIQISGGTVTATPGDVKVKKAAAIGNGVDTATVENAVLSCGTISITGGTVTANGNIGYGDVDTKYYPETDAKIEISGGTVDVSDGTISNLSDNNIDWNCVWGHYNLKFTIHDSDLQAGTQTGTVTIGNSENAWSKDISFSIENGTAVATEQVNARLHGQQSVAITIGEKTYDGMIINLDEETEVIWGAVQGLQVANASGCTYTYINGILTFSGNGSATVTMADGVSSTEDSIQIADGATVTLTLQDLNIDSTDRNRPAITVGTDASTENCKCKLILVENNTLVRNAWNEAVIDALGESTLTIAGNGKVVVTNSKGGRGDAYCYGAGIRSKKGTMIFNGNPEVEVTKGSSQLVAIFGSNITINGGNIKANSGNSGHGIGYEPEEYKDDTVGIVTINGGTVYAEGGRNNVNAGGIANNHTQLIVNGGNVHMNRDYISDQTHTIQPKNTNGDSLWCVPIEVGRGWISTISRDAKVLGLTITKGEGTYEYKIDNMYTDGAGKLYLWLPADSVVTQVKTTNGIYTGTCKTEVKTTSGCSGSEWGRNDNYNVDLRGSMFYPVTDITLTSIPDTVGSEYSLNEVVKVIPENATNGNVNNIEWKLEGPQDSTPLTEGKLHVDKPGTYKLTAIIPGGAGGGEDFSKTFTLNMKNSISIYSLAMSGWTYGENPAQPTYNITEEYGNLKDSAKIEYSTEQLTGYTEEVPTNAGQYWVQVTIPATANTVECISRTQFEISPKSITASDIQAICEEQYFTGKAITPNGTDVKVLDGDNLLGTSEYEIKQEGYANNTELSSATSKASLTIQGKGNYTGEREIPFIIVNKPMAVSAIVSTADWTNQTVTISAPEGYTICQKKDSYDYDKDFTRSFIFEEESADDTGTVVYYLLKDDTGAISAEKTINVKIDQTKPSFEGTDCGIWLDTENVALKQNQTFAFNLYKQVDSATISLKAEDQPSGVKDYFYHVDQMKASEKNSYQVKSAAELAAQESGYWTTGSTIELNEEGFYVIYAYAVDQADNQSDYICSRGIVLDVTAPTWTGRLGNVKADSAEILLETDEDSICKYFLSETEVDADKITDEQWKSVDVKETQNGRSQALTLAVRPTTQYYVYLRMHDPTGNVTDVQTLRFRTPARPSSGGSHKSNKEDTTTSAGTPAPTLPAAPAETPKRDLSNVKLPGAKTEDKTSVGEADVKEPHVSGDEGKSGWDVIKDELKDALKDAQDQTDGPATVKVDMNGATVVPGDIFDSVKGLDIDVVFDMGDGITWTVNGMDITADRVNDIDFGVTTGADAGQSIPVDVINNVTGERYSMNLSLAYDGAFGFQAVLTVNMDQKNAGLYANLFYYNEDSGELEFICAGEIGSDGNVDLTFSHASDYVVVIDAQPMGVAAVDTDDTDTADTADDAQQAGAVDAVSGQNSGSMLWIVLLVIAVILAGAGIILVRKGKKKEE